ncbi:pseudouridine synthase [Flavobacteriaceae bacterium M23B6Z8]
MNIMPEQLITEIGLQQHFMIYKPFGVLSQLYSNNDKQNRKKQFLRKLYDFPEGMMPIGRLDEKSEGLLLMTTDGKLSDRINRSGIEKEYLVQIDGQITPEAIKQLQQGVEIGFAGKRYVTKTCKVEIIEKPTVPPADKRLRIERHRSSSWIRIVITEGKFRQIRKMTAAVGFPTARLIRTRIGSNYLGNLQPGEVKKVNLLDI